MKFHFKNKNIFYCVFLYGIYCNEELEIFVVGVGFKKSECFRILLDFFLLLLLLNLVFNLTLDSFVVNFLK